MQLVRQRKSTARKVLSGVLEADHPPPADTRETLNSSVRVSAVADGAQLEGERKTVTALFADIKGSTELEQDLDPKRRAPSSTLRSS